MFNKVCKHTVTNHDAIFPTKTITIYVYIRNFFNHYFDFNDNV